MGKIEKVRVLRNDRREGKKVFLGALLRWCVLVVFLIGGISEIQGTKGLFGLLVPKDAGHPGGRNGGGWSQWAGHSGWSQWAGHSGPAASREE